MMVAASVLLYTWVLVTAALSLAPMFPFLGQEFRLNQQQLSLLTGVNVLTLGFFTLFGLLSTIHFLNRITDIF